MLLGFSSAGQSLSAKAEISNIKDCHFLKKNRLTVTLISQRHYTTWSIQNPSIPYENHQTNRIPCKPQDEQNTQIYVWFQKVAIPNWGQEMPEICLQKMLPFSSLFSNKGKLELKHQHSTSTEMGLFCANALQRGEKNRRTQISKSVTPHFPPSHF